MANIFLPFSLYADTNYNVVWEYREDVISKYKGRCTECKTSFSVNTKRSMFVLVPEDSDRKRKPFYTVTCCSTCLPVVRQKIEAQFKQLSASISSYYAYEVEKALKEGGVSFIASE